MRFRRYLPLVLLASTAHPQSTTPPVVWHPWSDAIFAQAAREHKFVLLDLEAVWCHWCHVMDQQTYSNPAVRRLMSERYIAVKVDQDSRPDISNRYEDYGWPATVIFNAKGGEIVKRQGYLPPVQMASILQAVIDDPSPGPSVEPEKSIAFAVTPFLAPALLDEVKKEYEKQYDVAGKGWAFGHKYQWSTPPHSRGKGTSSRSNVSARHLTLRRNYLIRSGEAPINTPLAANGMNLILRS
jgi:hypothetical protein